MTGSIWMVQTVLYPTFNFIDPKRHMQFERLHQQKLSALFIPFMLIEVITSLVLCFSENNYFYLIYVNILLVAAILYVTYVVQKPTKSNRGKKRGRNAVKKMIWGNWARTILWSVRALVMLIIVGLAIAGI